MPNIDDAPEETLAPPGGVHTPPYQEDKTRVRIVLLYWLVIALGLPLWWSVTSIERLALPRGRIQELSRLKGELLFPVAINLDTSRSHFDTLVVQEALETRLRHNDALQHAVNVSVKAISDRIDTSPSTYTIHIASASTSQPAYQIRERDLLVQVPDGSPVSMVADSLSAVLIQLLLPPADNAYRLRVAQYAPRYRLAFSLLNEDASVGGGALGWDVEQAIRRYLSPTIRNLNVLHNFTVESQVQFHAPLAFEPYSVSGPDPSARRYAIAADNLKVFVNSAEWTLASSTSNDPVLHFLLFIPSRDRRPVHVEESEGVISDSNAFIVPQWGGIVILNPSQQDDQSHLDSAALATPFAYFDTQLKALLGVPGLPPSVSSSSAGISPWQLDSLLRYRSAENVRSSIDTTSSIVKLVDRIKGMPVGKAVRSDVESALDALEEIEANAKTADPATTLLASARAFVHSSAAFFNPKMVAMLYFPVEHKYAVYTPLFAPVAVPLVVALLKEIGAWVASRRAGKTKTE